MPVEHAETYKCPICQDVYSLETVKTKCDHYFFCECLSNYIHSEKSDPVLCPVCSDFVSTSDVKSADERFHKQLTKLPVKCGKCEKTMSYDLMSHHNCDINTSLRIPSTSESVIIETAGQEQAHSTPKPNKSHVEMQIQTSSIFGTFTQEESPESTFNKTVSRSITSSLNKNEERLQVVIAESGQLCGSLKLIYCSFISVI